MLVTLIELFMKGLKACGCLLTLGAAGLVAFAVFGMTTPAAKQGRGMVVFLAMIAALFGLPILLGSLRKGPPHP